MKYILLFLWFSASAKQLTLVVNTPAQTPTSDKIYLTGDRFCNWKPDCIELQKLYENTYVQKLDLDADQVSFKITRGTWATEAADAQSKSFSNYNVTLKEQNTVVFSIPNWVDHAPLRVIGEVRYHPDFYSPELSNKRTIKVWLPPSYRDQNNLRYPVIYFHDGQNAFDPTTSFTGIDWGIDDTMTALIEQNLIKEAIIVAIDNVGNDRFLEYDLQNPHGQAYSQFLISTVKPFIDKTYRTLSDRENTFLMGSSMGALISLSMAWKYDQIFSKAAGLSLPVLFMGGNIYQTFKQTKPTQKLFLYFDNGDWGQDQYYVKYNTEFSSWLRPQLEPGAMIYKQFPYANHQEIDWARRLSIPLRYLLAK